MRPNSLLVYVRAVPFRPFRIVMNNGKSYDVGHPEFISVARDVFVHYHRDESDGPLRQFDTVSLLLISHIEFLSPPELQATAEAGPMPA